MHCRPAVFVLGTLTMILLALFWQWLAILPLVAYLLAVWITAIASTRSMKIGTMAVLTSVIQLGGYGTGFIKAWVWKILLRHGRNIEEEIEIRRGK